MWLLRVAVLQKTAWQVPTVLMMALQRAIFALLERILVLEQTSAQSAILAISPPLRVQVNV